MADGNQKKKNQNLKGQASFCVTGLPGVVEIEVDEMSFHFHKFPLMSKSKKLHDMITDREQNPLNQEDENSEGIEEIEIPKITLNSFPGSSETFELAAKFCYGVKVNLTASNAVKLWCAAEYLEMTEEFAEENLINLTDRFLNKTVYKSLKYSIKALKSCEDLCPLAEELGIVSKCIDSIVARANSLESNEIFDWPIAEESNKNHKSKSEINAGSESWLEELAKLTLPFFKRVISAMKEKRSSSEIIEGCLISYATKSFPGLTRSGRHLPPSTSSLYEHDQKELLETIITNLPLEKTSVDSTKLLFRMLRTNNILNGSEECKSTLERKIAAQLERATIYDLLMPSYSYLVETLYDVETVERILRYYLERLEREMRLTEGEDSNGGLVRVGRLIDGYLEEIASDINLRVDKFCELALSLPEHARVYDDGLYRAIDLYLKAHPNISQAERDKICSVMDCRKLTLEACTLAAQNERLPLRAVVQVLFLEKLQLRQATAGNLIAPNNPAAGQHSGSIVQQGNATWRTAVRDNQLKLDLDSMQSRVRELEKECSNMKKAIERVGRKGTGNGSGSGSSKSLSRFGCKFGTMICDSQERTVTEPRRSHMDYDMPSRASTIHKPAYPKRCTKD